MEGLPLRNLIAVIAMLFILYASVYVTDFFGYFVDRENLRNAVEDISEGMELLASGNEFGSWSDIRIAVPKGAVLYVNETSDCIETTDYNVNSKCVKYDVNNSLTLTQGDYSVRIFYGYNTSEKELMIAFAEEKS